jgi:hypothetical protein
MIMLSAWRGKAQISEAEARNFIVGARILTREKNGHDTLVEEWNLYGFQFSVKFELDGITGLPLKTKTGRWFGIVSGHKLGGFVGVSYDPGEGNYRVGTPDHAVSERLVAALWKAYGYAEAAPTVVETRASFHSRVDFLEKISAPRAFEPDAQTEPSRAREIMGGQFLGVDDVCRFFGERIYTPNQLAALAMIPFSDAELRDRAEKGFFLVPDYPLSVRELTERLPNFVDMESPIGGRGGESFCEEKPNKVRWRLVHLNILPEMLGRGYDEQKALLAEGEEVATVATVVRLIALHYLATGMRLLPDDHNLKDDVRKVFKRAA